MLLSIAAAFGLGAWGWRVGLGAPSLAGVWELLRLLAQQVARRVGGGESGLLDRRDVDDILTVGDAQLVEGMRFFAERMKMVVEPTGCLAFAAACAAGDAVKGRRVGVIVSGGNVDLARYAALLAGQGL